MTQLDTGNRTGRRMIATVAAAIALAAAVMLILREDPAPVASQQLPATTIPGLPDHRQDGTAANAFMAALARGDAQSALGYVRADAVIAVGVAADKADLAAETEFNLEQGRELAASECAFVSPSADGVGTDVRCDFVLTSAGSETGPVGYTYEITLVNGEIVELTRIPADS